MQSVNGAQFLNITSLFLSSACFAANNCATVLVASGFGSGPASPAIVIVLLTSIYASLESYKLDFNIVVLNLISLLILYIPLDSSFISMQFLVLNLDG